MQNPVFRCARPRAENYALAGIGELFNPQHSAQEYSGIIILESPFE